MKVEKDILKVWRKFLDPENVYYDAKDMGADHRTLKKAVRTGKCSKPVYDKINAFIAKKTIEINPLLKHLKK